MKKYIIFAAVILLFSSCEDRPRVGEATITTDSTERGDIFGEDSYVFDYKNTELSYGFVDIVFHEFSDNESKDKFTFFVPKGNINETSAILTIQNAVGDTLFADTIKTTYMIDRNVLGEVADDQQMLTHIIVRAKSILANTSFCRASEPDTDNIFTDSLSDDEYDNIEILREVKEENRYLFCLSLMEDDVIYIGYSKEKKKADIVFSCC